MNKYLDLAQQVLMKTDGMMSARQIWDIAEAGGMTKGQVYGKTPWVTLGRLLAIEVKRHPKSSAFLTTSGNPVYYFLKDSDIHTRILHEHADYLESDGLDTLLKRVRNRTPKPTAHLSQSKVYDRDPNLIAYVRLRAGHSCEVCGKEGFRKENGHLYIEVHHIKRLTDGEEDTPENAAAVCADCHRKLHHSAEKEELLTKLLAMRHFDVVASE